MKPADLLQLLRDFYADKRRQRDWHEASARIVRGYDFNNTYQYVVNREDAHLSWLREAIEDLGGAVAEPVAEGTPPEKGDAAVRLQEDAREAQALVDRWQGRFGQVTHARHRLMLDVVLGETREHQRFFAQAAAGRVDLLGRRTSGSAPVGGVLPTRWVE